MTDLSYCTANELAAKVRDGEVSALELTDHQIERIERLDGDVNAVVVRDFERARDAARAADERRAAGETLGALHGVPMTIKESYDIAGLPTTWGIPAFKDNVAASDAESVKAYKDAGAIFLGKTNAPLNLADFQSYNDIYGTTGNPFDTGRTPGGSSGGSAAALAAGFAALESGSDIGGSIRNPAHYCGVYGHKPTWCVVPPQGHWLPGATAGPDIAVCGPMARSAEDLALAMDLLAGPQPLDRPGWQVNLPAPSFDSLSGLRVALWPDDAFAPVAREVSDRVAQIGDTLSRLGATVSDTARPDFTSEHSHDVYERMLHSVMGAGMTDDVFERMQEGARGIDPADSSPNARVVRATTMTHRDWLRAHHARERLRYAWRAFFDDWDVLICPQSATPAFPHDHSPIADRTLEIDGVTRPYFEQLFWAGLITVAYLPSTVFPSGPSQDGLPIGLQAVGPEYADRSTIEFTRLLAQEIGGFTPPPAFA